LPWLENRGERRLEKIIFKTYDLLGGESGIDTQSYADVVMTNEDNDILNS
jgi:hypothetical protein